MTPDAKKLPSAASAPRIRSMCVMYRPPFTAKTKPSGVCSAQAR
jgi:hypothetical protein